MEIARAKGESADDRRGLMIENFTRVLIYPAFCGVRLFLDEGDITAAEVR